MLLFCLDGLDSELGDKDWESYKFAEDLVGLSGDLRDLLRVTEVDVPVALVSGWAPEDFHFFERCRIFEIVGDIV